MPFCFHVDPMYVQCWCQVYFWTLNHYCSSRKYFWTKGRPSASSESSMDLTVDNLRAHFCETRFFECLLLKHSTVWKPSAEHKCCCFIHKGFCIVICNIKSSKEIPRKEIWAQGLDLALQRRIALWSCPCSHVTLCVSVFLFMCFCIYVCVNCVRYLVPGLRIYTSVVLT